MNDFKEEIVDPADVVLPPNTAVVFNYWNGLRGERFAPAWSEFDWLGLPAQLIPWCAVVDVGRDPPSLVYRFFGTRRVALQRRDYTGHDLDTVRPPSLAAKVIENNRLVVDSRRPKFFTTLRKPAGPDAEPVEYHFLRLPFSDTGEFVDQVLSFGMFEEAEIKKVHDLFDAGD